MRSGEVVSSRLPSTTWSKSLCIFVRVCVSDHVTDCTDSFQFNEHFSSTIFFPSSLRLNNFDSIDWKGVRFWRLMINRALITDKWKRVCAEFWWAQRWCSVCWRLENAGRALFSILWALIAVASSMASTKMNVSLGNAKTLDSAQNTRTHTHRAQFTWIQFQSTCALCQQRKYPRWRELENSRTQIE